MVPGRAERPIIRWPEVGGLLAAGLFLELSLRTGLANVAAVLAVLTISATLLTTGRLVRPSARYLVLGAAVLAPWLTIRSSAGLTTVTIMAISALLALAAGLSRSGSLTDMKALALLNHLIAQSIEWIYGLAMTRRLLAPEGASRPWLAVSRGFAVASPILLVFTILLSAADRTFAGFFVSDLWSSSLGHVLLAVALAVLMLGLMSRAAHETAPYGRGGLAISLGSVEVKMVLGGVAGLFAAFVATQVVVALAGGYVLNAENLSQAEHARRGFFQLLWVAALALALLGVIRSIRPDGRVVEDDDQSSADADDKAGGDGFKPLAIMVLGLTLVITAISIQRLAQYVDAFGYTPLRLWSLVASVWIGVILIADIVSIAGVGRGRSWFPSFLIVSAAVFVFVMNVVNPDAFVASRNLTNPVASIAVDTGSLARLSDDAIPAAIEHLDELDAESAVLFRARLCSRPSPLTGYGILGVNFAERNAEQLLDLLCNTSIDLAVDGSVVGP